MNHWTKHLKDPEEIARFERTLWNSKPILDRLKQLVSEKEQSLDRSEASLEAYEKPNWAFIQAHKNGYRSCQEQIKALLTLDPKELK